MSAAWDLLPRTALSSSTPPLLVKFDTNAAGYTIHVTDLSRIWSESLSNAQVVQRSLDEETSIEPKDNPDQLRVLLARIGDGIRGRDETKLSLLSGDDVKHLRLNVSARLPSPFRPLQWPVYLTPLNAEALRAELLIPLLANQKVLRQQVASLLVHIKEKDNVIMKLTDKLESLGTDMTMVFPGAVAAKVGRRGLGREMAVALVPGLAAFDEGSWRNATSEAEIPCGDETELISSLFPNELPGSKQVTNEHPLNAWWNTFPRKTKRGYECGKVEGEATELDIDDEFETQTTPPSLEKREMLSQTPEALNRNSRRESEQRDSAAPHSKSKKLGLIGGRVHMNVLDAQQADTSEASGNGVQRSSSSANDHAVGSADQAEQAPRHFLPSSASSMKLKHRFGVIGGKRKNIEGDVSDMSTKPATSRVSPDRSTERMGDTKNLNVSAIPAMMLDEEVHENQDRSSYASRTPNLPETPLGIPSAPRTHMTPSPGESQERADRKRAELRKILEEKAKAPIQKRRRF